MMVEFGTWGSAEHHQRYRQQVDASSRRRCHCGCKSRATHLGMANGVALTMGCEFFIRRWVRDGSSVFRRPALTETKGL